MFISRLFSVLALLVALLVAATASTTAIAAEGGKLALPKYHWSFSGPFGTYDRSQLQRGLQVYVEVCSSCHALENLHYRDLEKIGYSATQVEGFAAGYAIDDDTVDDLGDPISRPATPADPFVRPYPNPEAARAANGGAYPPDLSLMTKARKGGADYVAALLLGYSDDIPQDVVINEGGYYNVYYGNQSFAMSPPLTTDEQVSYADGTEATMAQMATDVAAFLNWAADPYLEERKSLGVKVMIVLFLTLGILIIVKRRIWQRLH